MGTRAFLEGDEGMTDIITIVGLTVVVVGLFFAGYCIGILLEEERKNKRRP